jgi:hypothetical protein
MNLCDTATVDILVTPKPLPPEAVDDVANTLKNQVVIIDSLQNDNEQKVSQVETVVKITNQPKSGAVVFEDNKFKYTPNTDFVGQDEFEYEICNGNNLCDKALVKVTVTDPTIKEPNPVDNSQDSGNDTIDPQDNSFDKVTPLDPVKANSDSVQTNQNTPVTVGILTNDEYKNITTIIVTNTPDNGKATINSDKQLIYTPNNDFAGTDTLTYKICNQSLCSEATVEINVKPKGIVLGDVATLVRSGGGAVYAGGVFLGLILILIPISIFTSFSKNSNDV